LSAHSQRRVGRVSIRTRDPGGKAESLYPETSPTSHSRPDLDSIAPGLRMRSPLPSVAQNEWTQEDEFPLRGSLSSARKIWLGKVALGGLRQGGIFATSVDTRRACGGPFGLGPMRCASQSARTVFSTRQFWRWLLWILAQPLAPELMLTGWRFGFCSRWPRFGGMPDQGASTKLIDASGEP